MSSYLDVDALKAYLRIGDADTVDDVLLAQIVDTVEAQQRARLIPAAFIPTEPPAGVQWSQVGHTHDLTFGTTAPDAARAVEAAAVDVLDVLALPPIDAAVYQAALMRGARLYMRRASPEGIVGLGDLGVARVPAYDRDIDVLETPWIQFGVA